MVGDQVGALVHDEHTRGVELKALLIVLGVVVIGGVGGDEEEGLVLQLALQVFLNIAVVTNTIPNTGIGLPFFSYGGTSMLMTMGQMGLILSVSRYSSLEKG